MRQTLLSILALFFICSVTQAQVYVNAAASGANDGTSWADAYTDLQTALDSTESGAIWVAAGTYVPGTDSTGTFFVSSSVDLYGGFAGTESNLEDRDITGNPTILSGDSNGDDAMDDLLTNRGDNARHVVTVDSFIVDAVGIDGFTITAGSNNPLSLDTQPLETSSGGGVLAFSTTDIANCTFTQNYGGAGAAVMFLDSGTEGSSIEDCEFIGNESTNWGIAQFYYSDGGILRNSSFTGNTSVRGGIYAQWSIGTLVEDCVFSDNVSGATGAGIYFWQCVGTIVRNCEITENTAGLASGVYADFRFLVDQAIGGGEGLIMENVNIEDNTTPDDSFGAGGVFWQPMGVRIEDCSFVDNQAGNSGAFYVDMRDTLPSLLSDSTRFLVKNTDFLGNTSVANERGGGVWAFSGSPVFDNCLFEGNTTVGNAGAIYVNGIGGNPRILNSEFEGNTADGAGGCIYSFPSETFYVDNCIFRENVSPFAGAAGFGGPSLITNSVFEGNLADGNGGGAILVGFQGDATFENCNFSENTANYGGAFWVQNDTTALTVRNSIFNANISTASSGGGILTSGGISVTIDSCTFESNTAAFFGGGIAVGEPDGEDIIEATLDVARSTFFLNTAIQGGAINFGNVDGSVTNCIMFANNANVDPDNGGGNGGAISVNISGSEPGTVNIINNTMASNSGETANNVAVFQDSIAVATVNMQNNIFYGAAGANPNVAIEAGTPDIVSLGGNLLLGTNTTDLNLIFDQATDLIDDVTNIDDVVVFPLGGDYRLEDGSIAINAGVLAGAPATDIVGFPRPDPVSGLVDIGAYEADLVDAREEVVDDANQMIILPNPVRDMLYVQMNNDWTGELDLRVMNLKGQQVALRSIQKFGVVQTFELDLAQLPAGHYEVLVSNGEQLLVRQLIKQ